MFNPNVFWSVTVMLDNDIIKISNSAPHCDVGIYEGVDVILLTSTAGMSRAVQLLAS